ncbi:MAG: helix-turn-helix transcriptional regulator [Magnetococcales bacterium]|nr:helix-turn-helix transcriptional regulator [Magnetococcales bacterium]
MNNVPQPDLTRPAPTPPASATTSGPDGNTAGAAYDPTPEGLRKRLRERRKALKMSQAKLADKAGLARDTIGRYERGELSPSTEAFRALVIALNASANWLLFGKREPPLRKPSKEPKPPMEPMAGDMTLRDFFAAHALTALARLQPVGGRHHERPRNIATDAFCIADEMMEQR